MAMSQNPVPLVNILIQPLKWVLKWVVHLITNRIPLVLTHGQMEGCLCLSFTTAKKGTLKQDTPMLHEGSLVWNEQKNNQKTLTRCLPFFLFMLRLFLRGFSLKATTKQKTGFSCGTPRLRDSPKWLVSFLTQIQARGSPMLTHAGCSKDPLHDMTLGGYHEEDDMSHMSH